MPDILYIFSIKTTNHERGLRDSEKALQKESFLSLVMKDAEELGEMRHGVGGRAVFQVVGRAQENVQEQNV